MEPTPRAPLVVNLGKSTRKRIKKLKRGEGKLMRELQGTLDDLKAAGKIAADAEPVVFVVERRSGFSMSRMPLPMPMQKFFS